MTFRGASRLLETLSCAAFFESLLPGITSYQAIRLAMLGLEYEMRKQQGEIDPAVREKRQP